MQVGFHVSNGVGDLVVLSSKMIATWNNVSCIESGNYFPAPLIKFIGRQYFFSFQSYCCEDAIVSCKVGWPMGGSPVLCTLCPVEFSLAHSLHRSLLYTPLNNSSLHEYKGSRCSHISLTLVFDRCDKWHSHRQLLFHLQTEVIPWYTFG